MKAILFLIDSHLLIAVAAVSLALATQVQIGLMPVADSSMAVILFATLFEYNLHSYLKVKRDIYALTSERNTLAANKPSQALLLIILSFAGLIFSLFFVRQQIIVLLIALAFPTVLYSIVTTGKNIRWRIKQIPGLKIFLIAFTWSAVTIFVPLLKAGIDINPGSLLSLFAARFAFIFAIAIPFDIRDMKSDRLSGLITIPNAYGFKRALLISNFALAVSTFFAFVYCTVSDMIYFLPAYFVSFVLTSIFINSKRLGRLPFYYHGILDGTFILHGILLSMSFYLEPILF